MKKQIRQHQKRELKLQRRRMRSLRGRRLGLYIHIPFCRRKCDYCDFYSLANSEDRMRDYIRALLLNLQELAPRTEGYVLDTIYLGGGTPSILPESALKQLFKAIHKEYHLTRDCEITVEVNPDSVTPSLLRTLRHGGVNRISMGVQSAHDQELTLLNRLHTFEQAEQAVKLIRKAGFKNLNLDLIFGLPDQTMAAWQESVEAILALEPEHISMYALTLEEGTPLWQRKDELNLVSSDDQADEYLWAVNRLAELGYEQYEVSNFAKEGYRSRHNRKYWLGQEYVGVGPSAHSDFGGRRYSYVRDLEGYISGMLNGGVIVDSSEMIPPEERGYEYLMLRMRTVEGIEGNEYSSTFRMNFTPLEKKLEQFRDSGWVVQEDNGRWHFTPTGFLLSNQLIGELLESQEENRLEVMLATHRAQQAAEAAAAKKKAAGQTEAEEG